MGRANNSGIKLTASDAAIVKGMLHRGDRQHDIASWFGVNGGRIAEISTRKKFGWVVMQTEFLPPKGPYLSGKAAHEASLKIYDLISLVQNNTDLSNKEISGYLLDIQQILQEWS